MMKVANKTGKQGPELVARVAELESENTGQAREVEELKVCLSFCYSLLNFDFEAIAF